VGVKTRKKDKRWLVSMPEDMKGRTFSAPRLSKQGFLLKPVNSCVISEDWVSVAQSNDGSGGRRKIEIPTVASPGSGLRVKVGHYEFEADENFPTDKLAEILRGLAGDCT
jgi:hypothetical protein